MKFDFDRLTWIQKGLNFGFLTLGSAHFWPNMFEVQAFLTGLKGFEFRFWWMNLGSCEFEFRKFV